MSRTKRYFRGRARGAKGLESRAVASGRMKGDAAERYLADEISAAAACNDRSGDCARFRASLRRALSGGRYRVSTATSNCPSLGDILANRKRGVDIGGAIHPVFTLAQARNALRISNQIRETRVELGWARSCQETIHDQTAGVRDSDPRRTGYADGECAAALLVPGTEIVGASSSGLIHSM